jgi:hypothetical protein
MWAVPHLCIILCPGICLTTEEKSWKNLSGHPICFRLLCPARFVWLTWSLSSDALHWPAGPCRSWLTRRAEGPTLGQRRYLLSCRTRGSLTSGNLELKLTVGALMCVMTLWLTYTSYTHARKCGFWHQHILWAVTTERCPQGKGGNDITPVF